MIQIVVFASGSGTNAENIIHFFKDSKKVTITNVLCNNPTAKVFERCEKLQVPCTLFDKEDFFTDKTVLHFLQQEKTDFVILAGFLWKIPKNILAAFSNKIINIHPALLPKYGGKGMYGMHVHSAVKANNESETGITIHYVNENYDEGAIIFQAKTTLSSEDTAKTIAEKIHVLEQTHFPKVIENVLLKNE
jgi:phosphoribosylglycinamide formyltransferase-1